MTCSTCFILFQLKLKTKFLLFSFWSIFTCKRVWCGLRLIEREMWNVSVPPNLNSRQTKRKAERQKDRKTERQKDRKTKRQKDKKTERQKDRETERQKDRKTERQKDRKTERKKERKKERQFRIICFLAFDQTTLRYSFHRETKLSSLTQLCLSICLSMFILFLCLLYSSSPSPLCYVSSLNSRCYLFLFFHLYRFLVYQFVSSFKKRYKKSLLCQSSSNFSFFVPVFSNKQKRDKQFRFPPFLYFDLFQIFFCSGVN